MTVDPTALLAKLNDPLTDYPLTYAQVAAELLDGAEVVDEETLDRTLIAIDLALDRHDSLKVPVPELQGLRDLRRALRSGDRLIRIPANKETESNG